MKIRNQIIRMCCFAGIAIVSSLFMLLRSYLPLDDPADTTTPALMLSGIILPFILLIYAIRICDDTPQIALPVSSAILCVLTIGILIFSRPITQLLGLPQDKYGSISTRNLFTVSALFMCVGTGVITYLIARFRKKEDEVSARHRA